MKNEWYQLNSNQPSSAAVIRLQVCATMKTLFITAAAIGISRTLPPNVSIFCCYLCNHVLVGVARVGLSMDGSSREVFSVELRASATAKPPLGICLYLYFSNKPRRLARCDGFGGVCRRLVLSRAKTCASYFFYNFFLFTSVLSLFLLFIFYIFDFH